MGINVEPDVSKYLAEIQVEARSQTRKSFSSTSANRRVRSFEDFKSEIRNGYLTQRVIRQEVGSRISIPRAELEKYYNENKAKFMREDRVFLREILVSTEGKDEAGIAAAEKKARDLSARAKKGEKFPRWRRRTPTPPPRSNTVNSAASSAVSLNKQIEDIVFAAGSRFRDRSDSSA